MTTETKLIQSKNDERPTWNAKFFNWFHAPTDSDDLYLATNSRWKQVGVGQNSIDAMRVEIERYANVR